MNNVNENVPAWQFNTIPGIANQGAILMTRSNIGNPPFNQSDFVWNAMEDIIGTANVKMEYSEPENKYRLYKAKGHRDEEGEWSYEWTKIGEFDALTPETVEMLRVLKYVEYIYDADTPNVLKVVGVKKDGERETILNISYTTVANLNEAIAALKDYTDLHDEQITNRINTLETNVNNALKVRWKWKGTVVDSTVLPDVADQGDVYGVENESDMYVNISDTNTVNWVPFTSIQESFFVYGIELHKSTNGLYAKLRYDTIDFTIDNANNLRAQIIDDSATSGNRKTWSIDKLTQFLTSAMHYKGQVATYADLPTGSEIGDVYNVADTGDNYAWNGTEWDKLSGEYIAGTGISINGKTISATGIAFNVGDGLETTGSGASTTLKVKAGNAINVDSNGVSVKLGNTIEMGHWGIEVKGRDGLELTSNGLKVTAESPLIVDSLAGVKLPGNYTRLNTPLGNNPSNINVHSDGKISVEKINPVEFEIHLLYHYTFPTNVNKVDNLTIPNAAAYKLFYVEHIVMDTQGISIIRKNGMFAVLPGAETVELTSPRYRTLNNSDEPISLDITSLILEGLSINYSLGVMQISRVSSWKISVWVNNSPWGSYGTNTDNKVVGFRIYGVK